MYQICYVSEFIEFRKNALSRKVQSRAQSLALYLIFELFFITLEKYEKKTVCHISLQYAFALS